MPCAVVSATGAINGAPDSRESQDSPQARSSKGTSEDFAHFPLCFRRVRKARGIGGVVSMQDKAGVGGGNSIRSTAYFYRCFFFKQDILQLIRLGRFP